MNRPGSPSDSYLRPYTAPPLAHTYTIATLCDSSSRFFPLIRHSPDLAEQGLIRHGLGEYLHRRPQFHRVDRPEDCLGALVAQMLKHRRRTLPQAPAEHGMRRIGARFLEPRQAIIFGRAATPKVTMLWEDEPHPVAALLAGAELGQGLFKDPVRLRLDEPLEVERVGRVNHRLSDHDRLDAVTRRLERVAAALDRRLDLGRVEFERVVEVL